MATDTNTTVVSTRTTGSADFKSFVHTSLDDDSWSLSGASPSGFGIVSLRRLHGFLSHVISLEPSRRSNFGPTRRKLEELRSRLFALAMSDAPSKAVFFEVFENEVKQVISTWPPLLPGVQRPTTTDTDGGDEVDNNVGDTNPLPTPVVSGLGASSPGDDFYLSLASANVEVLAPRAPTVSPYPSVLLEVGRPDFGLTPDQLAVRLLKEINVFAVAGSSAVAMPQTQFAVMRPSIALTLQLLCKGAPVPATLPDVSLRSALRNFLTRQYNAVITNIRRAAAVHAVATPVPSTDQVLAGAATTNSLGASTTVSDTVHTNNLQLHAAVVALQRQVSSLVDHVSSGASPTDLATGISSPAVPAYIAKAFERPDPSLGVVPQSVSDELHAKDVKYLERLTFVRSLMNKGGRKIHPDIDAYIQKNFCSPQMSYIGYENRVSAAARRKSIIGQKLDIQDDVRLHLDIRIQRHRAEKRSLGNAISLQEIESLKTREFKSFSNIRMRLNLLFATDTDGKSAVASVITSSDAPFVRAAFGATTGQAKTLLAALQKSAMKRPSPRHPTGPGQPPTSKVKRLRACNHCGASGKLYHAYYKCPDWLSGKDPAVGSSFAKMLAAGKTIPSKSKKKKK